MIEPEAAPGLDPDDRPIEIPGPAADAEAIVRRAGPARLGIGIGLAAVGIAGLAAGILAARDAYEDRIARRAPMVHVPGAEGAGADPRAPRSAYDIDLLEIHAEAYATCARRGRCPPLRRGSARADEVAAAAYCAYAGKRLPTPAELDHARRSGAVASSDGLGFRCAR